MKRPVAYKHRGSMPIPDHIAASLQAYVERGVPAGGFLEAVLSNSLMDAFGRGDSEALAALGSIVAWLYNEAPWNCFGDTARVIRWTSKNGMVGLNPDAGSIWEN